MDHHLNAQRVHNNELGFNTTRMTFLFGNAAALAINAFADLDSASKMVMTILPMPVRAKKILGEPLGSFAY